MIVLVDTSVWIDYFKGKGDTKLVDSLIDENLIATNDLILAELIPYLRLQRQNKLVALMQEINNIPMHIDWQEIIEIQLKCLRKGFNGIGIPDLIIAQNAKQNNCKIYSVDKNFRVLNKIFKGGLFLKYGK